jgi:hypothetical protein
VLSVRLFRRGALSALLGVSAAISDVAWAAIGPALRSLNRLVTRWAAYVGGRLSQERFLPWGPQKGADRGDDDRTVRAVHSARVK